MTGPDLAISVKDLSKCYEIYEKPHHRLLQMISMGHKKFYNDFWALKDVSFSITRGKTVGILGRNGSGKSTLLKLICGTLHPTKGRIQTQGRIAAILELGSGFNPEFTGKENVYMKASILGLSDKETSKRFQSITDFAEIGEFIDQPVKTYSSGMIVRLAFAVAVNVDPEILVVDEALSVGDELFQRKCFSRIEEIRESGATILFVSHAGNIVVQLCDEAILLDEGEMLATGEPKKIYAHYQQLLYAPNTKQQKIRKQITTSFQFQKLQCNPTDENKKSSSGYDIKSSNQELVQFSESYNPSLTPTSTIEYESKGAIIRNPQILNTKGQQANNLIRGKMYTYTYDVHFHKYCEFIRFAMLIKTLSGVELGGAITAASKEDCLQKVKPDSVYKVQFTFHCALNPGSYFLNAGVAGNITDNGDYTSLHRIIDAAMFRVLPENNRKSISIVDFGCSSEVSEVSLSPDNLKRTKKNKGPALTGLN